MRGLDAPGDCSDRDQRTAVDVQRQHDAAQRVLDRRVDVFGSQADEAGRQRGEQALAILRLHVRRTRERIRLGRGQDGVDFRHGGSVLMQQRESVRDRSWPPPWWRVPVPHAPGLLLY